jgi:hypothetical protein
MPYADAPTVIHFHGNGEVVADGALLDDAHEILSAVGKPPSRGLAHRAPSRQWLCLA